MLNKWNIEVNTSGMPQAVATAFEARLGALVGVEYRPLAYLGSQVANGVNHAILAEQVLLTGRDTVNVVLIVFNEREGGYVVERIERVLGSGGALGGVKVAPVTRIPEAQMELWDRAFDGFVGSEVRPFALLGTQVTTGVNFYFAAELEPVGVPEAKRVVMVVVNGMADHAQFVDILPDAFGGGLGYAFTWLR